MRRFFEFASAARLDEARSLLHGEVVTFPLYRTSQPVLRGARPLMERLAVLGEVGVTFDFTEFRDLGDGYVLASGEVGPAGEKEPSFVLCNVVDGRIATMESHESLRTALATLGRSD